MNTLLLDVVLLAMGCAYILIFRGGKSYIGITAGTLSRRLSLHKSHAKHGRSGAVYNALRKYGSCTAETLLFSSDWKYLQFMEKRIIAAFGTLSPGGYNLTAGGEGTQGRKLTAEQRANISARLKGRPSANKGKRGYRHTKEALAKISKAGKGREFTKERRARIGATKVGNTYNVGRVVSNVTREKISASQKGRKFTEEHKIKLSCAAKLRGMSANIQKYWNRNALDTFT